MVDVVWALFLRELQTRFGKNRLGILWVLGEPILQVMAFVAILGMHHPLGGGDNMVAVLVTGIVPWLLFRSCMNQVMRAASANTGLFSYRQVRPSDAMVARALLESCIFLGVYLVLVAAMAWWGMSLLMPAPLELSAALGLLALLGACMGALLAALEPFVPMLARAVSLGMRPLHLVSGSFYAVETLPAEWREYLMWNPLLHLVEQVRLQQIPGYHTEAGWLVPAVWGLAMLAAALVAYRLSWRRMISA